MSKEIQFELWEECNSRCTYCSLGLENRLTSNERKLQSIKVAIDELSKIVEPYEVVGFIGGEFFQGQLSTPEIYNEFMKLMSITNDLVNKGLIKTVWINATMTIGDQSDLWKTIEHFDDQEKLWILTSYDTKGRFHNEQMFETWEHSINYLHDNYPKIRLNTTSIITGDFIDNYLNDTFNIDEFKKKYNTSLFLKTTVKPDHWCHLSNEDINKILGNFFPTRKKFRQFLLKYKMKEGDTAFENLFSNELKSEEVRKNFNNDEFRNISFIRDKKTYKETLDCDAKLKFIDTMDCGHSIIYKTYCDSDKCSICDKQEILEL